MAVLKCLYPNYNWEATSAVGIITPYAAQVDLIKKKLCEYYGVDTSLGAGSRDDDL